MPRQTPATPAAAGSAASPATSRPPKPRPRRSAVRKINLALQGGGAHGAFTWGVLDRLLDEQDIEVEGITGTSAGAMNAAVFKAGWLKNGRQGARDHLEGFWRDVARAANNPPNPLLEWVRVVDPSLDLVAQAIEASPLYYVQDTVSRAVSPYDANPFGLNPLRSLLDDWVEPHLICEEVEPKLFICATNVRTGKIRVFRGEEISADTVLASACLPTLFKAVEIRDPKTGEMEAFWDGGYTGNPALFPLFDACESRDVMIVHINPIERLESPRSARDILNRINEISFNSSLLRDLRAIAFVKRLIATGRVAAHEMKDVLVHSIADDDTMRKLGEATKMQPDITLLLCLREAGRAAMDRFLAAHRDDLGVRGTVDLPAMYG